jgi:hypothetical protein
MRVPNCNTRPINVLQRLKILAENAPVDIFNRTERLLLKESMRGILHQTLTRVTNPMDQEFYRVNDGWNLEYQNMYKDASKIVDDEPDTNQEDDNVINSTDHSNRNMVGPVNRKCLEAHKEIKEDLTENGLTTGSLAEVAEESLAFLDFSSLAI